MSAIQTVSSINEQQTLGYSSEKFPSKKEEPGVKKKLRKCSRKGSRICYLDVENITMLKKIPEKESPRSLPKQSDETFEKVDSYRSGESLFKTFTFEQTRDIEDPETAKCIEFWKSVMRKNLAPIKCTLIEREQNSPEKKVGKSEPKKETNKTIKKPEQLDMTEDTARIWSQALKEIRNRKLDKLKLYIRERCNYCADPFSQAIREDLGNESQEDGLARIISLNDWKPGKTKMDLMETSANSLRGRLSGKIKRISATQTTETRIKEDKLADSAKNKLSSVVNSDAKTKPQETPQEAAKKLSAVHQSGVPEHNEASTTDEQRKVSTEAQAPTVRCPCESSVCICVHKAAARNSRTSFVEIARENMPKEDKSTEKFFSTEGQECICPKAMPFPWMAVTCMTNPCPGKETKLEVEQSSSAFDMERIIGDDGQSKCICKKNLETVCSSEDCRNKKSQGSLVEGFPGKPEASKEPCTCAAPHDESPPCVSDVCPVMHPQPPSTKCVCDKSSPWSEAVCTSWSCRHRKIRAKSKVEDEEKIVLPKFPTIIEDNSKSCICPSPRPWRKVVCQKSACANKSNVSVTRHSSEKKFSPKHTSKTRSLSSHDFRKASRTSRENFSLKESVKVKLTLTPNKDEDCICTSAPPWKSVTCPSHFCKRKKELQEKQNKAAVSISVERLRLTQPSTMEASTECICKDKTLEPICAAYKCKDRTVDEGVPPVCICPKDQEEKKHEHFKCLSEKCKMKRIDRTCVCLNFPEAHCDTKTCVANPPASKTLKYQQKALRYDTQCICQVRGLRATQEVSCTSPECPFTKKPKKVSKKKVEMPYNAPVENLEIPEEVVNKCICRSKNISTPITCPSTTCKKNKSMKSEDSGDIFDDDEDASDADVCVCNPGHRREDEKEVICSYIQCPKTHVGEGGVVMNDKCVCTNLEKPCDQPKCPATEVSVIKRQGDGRKDRPYCYICGHYDCVSKRKLTVCAENYNNNAVEE